LVQGANYEIDHWFSFTWASGSALIQACEAAGATIPRYIYMSSRFNYVSDVVVADFVTMTGEKFNP